jgi:hypothetical protein
MPADKLLASSERQTGPAIGFDRRTFLAEKRAPSHTQPPPPPSINRRPQSNPNPNQSQVRGTPTPPISELVTVEQRPEKLKLPSGYHWYETMLVLQPLLSDEDR